MMSTATQDTTSEVVNTKQSSVPFPAINTLKVELLSENSAKYVPCYPNAREPIPFETEFFKGVATLVIRTTPVDEYFKKFFMGKRQFEVQVQGKFKREPQGEIYVGAEVTSKMELGMLTRSISKAALRFCGTMVNDLHYSFGEATSDPNHQVPHLVAPIFPTFDKVIVSPPGTALPPMNIPFNEDLDYRKQRMKFRLTSDAKIDIANTYSFSVNTSNLNLLDWTLVGIPMVRPMDLRTFFGGAAIQLVGYEIPHSVVADFPNAHPKHLLNYVFSMRLTPMEPDTSLPVMDFPLSDDDNDEVVDDDVPGPPPQSPLVAAAEDRGELAGEEEEEEEDDSDEDDHGKTDVPRARRRSRLFAKAPAGDMECDGTNKKQSNRISGWFIRHMGGSDGKSGDMGGGADGGGGGLEVQESPEYSPTDYELESSGDLRYCPACLELNDCRKEGKRRVLYFMPLYESASSSSGAMQGVSAATEAKEELQIDASCPRLRAYSEIAKTLPLCSIPRMYKNKRLSYNERRRRQIVETYRAAEKHSSPAQIAKLNHFLGRVSEADRAFLSGNQAVQHRSRVSRHQLSSSQSQAGQQPVVEDVWEGCVALATSRRHWSEQYMVLSKTDLTFYRSAESKKALHRVPLSAVACVQPVRPEEAPMGGFSFLQVETFARVHYLMVRSDMQLNDWVQAFITLLGSRILRSPFDQLVSAPTGGAFGGPGTGAGDEAPQNASLADAEEELYIAKSACWKLDKKRIFNYRRIIFNPKGLPDRWRGLHPNALMESIMGAVAAIAQSANQQQSQRQTARQWVKFLDEVSLLQTVDVTALSEPERMVFFLNLYHVMVVHGHMTIGPPPAWNYWNAFFNHITYLVGHEVVSVADVDHNLLRAAMSRPSALSVIPVPHTQFPDMALSRRDFRLNFCINNGSRSMPGVVPVYTTQLLDKQLDEMTALAVSSAIEVDLLKRAVVLPKVPLHDFAPSTRGRSGSTAATSLECLRSLLSYVRRDDRAAILKLMTSESGSSAGGANAGGVGSSLSIRFKNPSLRCRMFQILQCAEGDSPRTAFGASGDCTVAAPDREDAYIGRMSAGSASDC